ncbi:MAG: hypothetical protein CMD27_00950 [Flavobacteriales bacterium]|nr:hypothetical protein [Flavobacteriales bacterium]
MFNHSINNKIVFFVSSIFLLCLTYSLFRENYILLLFPFILALLYLSILHVKYLFYMVIFLTPLSMSLEDIGFDFNGFDIAFPTEPLLLGLMILVIIDLIFRFNFFKNFIKQPIVTVLILYLIWMFITCVTSTIPTTSFKLFITRLWYILPIFCLGVFFLQQKRDFSSFTLCYTLPFSVVIMYTTVRHSLYSFDKQSAHYMMSPFFNDHTSYGAMIAFFIPLLIAALFSNKKNRLVQVMIIGIIFLFFVGFVLSFSRAAWISLICAVSVMLLVRLKTSVKSLIFLGVIFSLFSFLFQNTILTQLSNNRQDSSDNLIEHFTSLSNISTDASNMERINRWKCAISMFKERPFLGWGPGTYQFQYAPFQFSADRTIISSNDGSAGNAHSEYLSALSESGFLGLVFFITLVGIVLIRIIILYNKVNDLGLKRWLLAIFTSLLSYFIHGFFNNFLDTDKASVAIWAVIAIVVSIDLANNKKLVY